MSAEDTPRRTGSCLCGAIQIETRGLPFRANLCHCTTCQKASGSAFAMLVGYQDNQVTYTIQNDDSGSGSGSAWRDYVDRTPETGRTLTRSFCGECGSKVRITSSSFPGRLVIPAGVLDGDKTAAEDLRPTVEFYCKHRAGWLGAHGGSERHEALAPGMAPSDVAPALPNKA